MLDKHQRELVLKKKEKNNMVIIKEKKNELWKK